MLTLAAGLEFCKRFPMVRLIVLVDDLSLHMVSARMMIMKYFVEAVLWMITFLRGVLMLPVSLKKCSRLASDVELGAGLDSALRALGLELGLEAAAVRQLGVDFTAARARSMATQQARYGSAGK